MDEIDLKDVTYIYEHLGACAGGICMLCPITRARGMVYGCNNDVAFKVASDILHKNKE